MLRLVVHPLAVSSPIPPSILTRHLLAPSETTQLDPASVQTVCLHQDSSPFALAALLDELPMTITSSGLVLEVLQSRLQRSKGP